MTNRPLCAARSKIYQMDGGTLLLVNLKFFINLAINDMSVGCENLAAVTRRKFYQLALVRISK